MDRAGLLDERYDEVDDLVRARHVPSPQLIGTPERATIRLATLRAEGVQVVGRLAGIAGGEATFAGSLRNMATLADLKLNRLLNRLDEWALASGVDGEVAPPERFEPTFVDERPVLRLPLGRDVRTVVFATGYRPDHSWLELPVLDRRGRLVHDGGVVSGAPGLYALGPPFLRRRRSTFIHGAEADTADLAGHLHRHLDREVARTPL